MACALHRATDFALSRDAVACRAAAPEKRRLSRAADCVRAMELAALRYRGKRATATDGKFFGGRPRFKKGALREMRAKCCDGPRPPGGTGPPGGFRWP